MKTGASFKANLPKEHQILIHIRKVWDRIIRLETASTTICTMTPGTSIMRSHLYQPLSPNAPWLPMFWRRRNSRKVPMDLVESGSSRSSSKSGSVLLVTSAPRELKIWWPCMVDQATWTTQHCCKHCDLKETPETCVPTFLHHPLHRRPPAPASAASLPSDSGSESTTAPPGESRTSYCNLWMKCLLSASKMIFVSLKYP